MRVMIAITCFIVVAFPYPIESMFPSTTSRRSGRPREAPFQLAARCYESFQQQDRIIMLTEGFYTVATAMDNGREYVIGYFEDEPEGKILCPFSEGTMQIKIRIDDDHANVYVPIFNTDPVRNMLFKKYSGATRRAEIKPIGDPLRIVRANP